MHRRGFDIIVFFLLLLGSANGLASTGLIFHRLTTLDGLSENHINGMFQDSRGFIWLGTNDGLNRYDGYEFKTYRVDPGNPGWIQSNLIYKIAEDSTGDLWIGSSDQGLFKYHYHAESFEHITIGINGQPFTGLSVNQILVDKDLILVGTETGINFIKRKGEQYEIQYLQPGGDSIKSDFLLRGFARAPENRFWTVTQRGFYLLTRDSAGHFSSHPIATQGLNIIRVLGSYESGVFLNTGDGLYYYSPEEGYRKIADIQPYRLLSDSKDNLWLSTSSALHFLKKEPGTELGWEIHTSLSREETPNRLSSFEILDLMEDSYGNIWIGTIHGLNRYNPNQKRFGMYGNTDQSGMLWGEHIRSIYEDSEGNIWIGTDGGGISFLPRNAVEQRHYLDFMLLKESLDGELAAGYDIEEVRIDGQNVLFIGCTFPDKIATYILRNGRPVRIPLPSPFESIGQMVFSITQDDHYLWLGTYSGGIFRYDKTTGDLKNLRTDHGLSSDIIRDLLIDKNGHLWIATGNGLSRLNSTEKHKEDPDFEVYLADVLNPGSISYNYVLTLFMSGDGSIWVGTMGGGLNKYLGNDEFLTIDTEDGLANNVIKGILEDGSGNLWISSNRGLSKYSMETGLISNFDIYDGLQDFEFGEHAALRLRNGEMLFGGLNGFNAFKPEDIQIETSLPDMVFTDLQLLHRSINVGESVNGRIILEQNLNELEELKFGNNHSSFSIHFSAIHYSAPMKNQYRYMLEGFDENWVRTDAKSTFARYTNLKPGRYIFKVMGSNNDGLWNPDPLTLTIRIVPPFWASWIAFIIYAALIVLGLVFFNRYTFIRIKEKNKLMMEHFEREKVQELSQMKLKFYTNISHEFRTPLTLIIGQLQSIIKNLESLGFEKIKQKNLIIFRNAKVLLRLINQLMDFRKLEQEKMSLRAQRGNLYLFLKEIYESFEELAYSKNIEFTFKSYSKNIEIWYDAEKIEKIFYNLLSNAFNYTRNQGKIRMEIKDKSVDIIEISIADTGVGINDSVKEHIFERFYQAKEIRNKDVGSTGIGLTLSKGLVEMHRGEINFSSKKGVGTTFFVCLPKGDTHLEEDEKVVSSMEVISGEKISPVISPNLQPEISESTQLISEEKEGKILIAEDNRDLREYLIEHLETNYFVQAAVDGKDALASMQWFEPDIIISDIKMPRMDGITLCQKLKSSENTSHIPILMLTSKSSEEAQIEGYNAGADAYVAKPFNMDVLLAQLKSILRRKDDFRRDFKKDIEFTLENDTLTQLDKKLLERTRELIEQNIMDPDYSVLKLAQDYGLSQDNLNKKLKALIGMTAKSYIRSVKLKRAARLLATGRYTVAEVTYDVGFSDLKYFRKAFKNEFDVSPSEFKSLKA